MLIAVAVIFTVCLSEKLGKIHALLQIRHNFKRIECFMQTMQTIFLGVVLSSPTSRLGINV